jgi:DNA (cytosine-5)-methyltransferase 1
VYKSLKDEDFELLTRVLEIYDQKHVARVLETVSRETINRWVKAQKIPKSLNAKEHSKLKSLLPAPPKNHPNYEFSFIDLFAGIGGIRRGFEKAGGKCVFTSEWNEPAIRTYKANYYCDPNDHIFNRDIRDITLSNSSEVSEKDAHTHIRKYIPKHDVLLAGFPCQPFSIAGVSKKNALGRVHGFEDKTQGTLFFDVARIIAARKPVAFVLENVKNLKSHDKGRTFKIILETLQELGYWVADATESGPNDPKIIDGKNFLPQHRERIILVGFRAALRVHEGFTLKDIKQQYPRKKPILGDILEPEVDEKYVLTPKLWEYLYQYAIKHKAKGNGFGYRLVSSNDTAPTLSARYYKDGSEILINRGFNPLKDFFEKNNQKNRPRRLTPIECARLMGFISAKERAFNIPVSDTQAYKQFGNSVVVPVFAAVAKMMKPRILKAHIRP